MHPIAPESVRLSAGRKGQLLVRWGINQGKSDRFVCSDISLHIARKPN